MPQFGSSRRESSHSTLGALAQERSKVAHRHKTQQDSELFEMNPEVQQSVQTPQFDRQGPIDASFVMGTVEDRLMRNNSPSHPINPTATELLWQHQSRVGDTIVFHHLKDDGKGRLSFFRASVNSIPESDLESRTPSTRSARPHSTTSERKIHNNEDRSNQTVECDFTKVPPVFRKAGENTSFEAKEFIVSGTSGGSPTQNAEPTKRSPSVDPPDDPSARSAIGVGLAVNILAIAVGGYLLQFAPSATEGNGLSVAKQPAESGAIAVSNAVPSNRLKVPKVPATVEWGESQNSVETEASQLLQQAYNRGLARDFLGALDSLKQIPEGTSAYSIARSKIVEYAEKHRYKLEVEAHQLLQQAYNRAEEKNFAAALRSIEKIPKGTIAYARVHSKLAEYREKQRQLTDTLDTASTKVSSERRTACSRPLKPSSPVSTSWEIRKPADVPTVLASIGSFAISQSLNPGDFLQEIAPHSVVISYPETELGS